VTPEPWATLTVASALLFAGGNALQKHGIARRLVLVWILGLLLTIPGVGLETQALALGDLSVVKPLSRVQSVFVVLIGVLLLGERVSRAEGLGIAVMLVGVAVLAAEPGDEVTRVPASWETQGLILAVALVVAALLAFLRTEIGLSLASGALFGLADVLMKLGTELVGAEQGGFDLASAAGFQGLLATTEFRFWLAAVLLAFGLQQLAFSRGRVSVIVPVIGACGTVMAIVLGLTLLREPFAVARLAGIAIVMAGLVTAPVLVRAAEPQPR
jgi:uncharacterized membrane protein